MPWSTSTHKGSTRASRALRDHVLRMYPHCYLHYPGCTGTSTEDDHVIPLYAGGTDHIANHRGACHHCHAIKSAREGHAARPTRKRKPEQHPGIRHTP